MGAAINNDLIPDGARPASRGRPRGQPNTREAILACAEQLLQRRGLSGFSYQHVADQLKIRPAAIHYHFPCKDDLGLALVSRYRDRFFEWSREQQQNPDAWQRLQAFFGLYLDALDDERPHLCPGSVLSGDFASLPLRVRHEVQMVLREVYEWLVVTLDDGQRAARLRFSGDAHDKALAIGAALQGGLQIARLSGVARFDQLLGQLQFELTGERPRGCLP